MRCRMFNCGMYQGSSTESWREKVSLLKTSNNTNIEKKHEHLQINGPLKN